MPKWFVLLVALATSCGGSSPSPAPSVMPTPITAALPPRDGGLVIQLVVAGDPFAGMAFPAGIELRHAEGTGYLQTAIGPGEDLAAACARLRAATAGAR